MREQSELQRVAVSEGAAARGTTAAAVEGGGDGEDGRGDAELRCGWYLDDTHTKN